MEPVKSPALDPLPMVAVYPVADAVAWVVMLAVASWTPSRYRVAAWLNDPGEQPNELDGQARPGLMVRIAWCHLPSLTVPPAVAGQAPKTGISSAALPAVASRHLVEPELMASPIGSPLVPPLEDSRVPDPVVLNHSSADSAPVPAKYPPGMVTWELVPPKLAAFPPVMPSGPAVPRVTLAYVAGGR